MSKRHQVVDRHGKKQDAVIRKIATIGKGTFGYVDCVWVKVHGRQTQEKLAMKVTKSTKANLSRLELDIMLQLEHPNVVDLKYYYHNSSVVVLIMEYMEDGDLYHFIHKRWTPHCGLHIYSELFAFQVFRALAYMHGEGIAHRDIKAENVMVSRKTGMAKLIDFNCSAVMNAKTQHSPTIGTKLYNAPEILLDSHYYDEKIDIWSGGVLLTEMILGTSIFFKGATGKREPLPLILDYLGTPTTQDFNAMKTPHSRRDKCEKVKKTKDFNKSLGDAPGISDKKRLLDLLSHIFTYNVAQRFSAYKVCQHKLFDYIKGKNGSVSLESGFSIPDVFIVQHRGGGGGGSPPLAVQILPPPLTSPYLVTSPPPDENFDLPPSLGAEGAQNF
jgi:serine/threonine protein kinase